MKVLRRRAFIILISIVVGFNFLHAQEFSKEACRIENNRIIFTLNLNWDKEKLKAFSEQFDLDTLILDSLRLNKPEFNIKGIQWKAKSIDEFIVEVSKNMNQEIGDLPKIFEIFRSEMEHMANRDTGKGQNIRYGINQLNNPLAIRSNQNKIKFFLPGYRDAQQAYISGNFNSWSTIETPMEKTNDGWTVTLELTPGKNLYKYIIDGRWIKDPGNEKTEKEKGDSRNSVFYVSNQIFELSGHKNAKRVFLAGSFNNFRVRELKMIQSEDGWILPIYLGQGSHTYKYIIDGRWILDPDNPLQLPDGRGNINSVINLGKPRVFKLDGYESSTNVFLSGSFNDWNPGEISMLQDNEGWKTSYYLGPGTWEYKFLIDGRWITDPQNPYKTGSGDYINSIVAIEPNHQFTLEGFSGASSVLVSGSFNSWAEDGYTMKFVDNNWIIPVHLQPGKYTYKFIVDGQWILDPSNDLWEENEYGTDNSVLWIE
ncbi:MAG: hypothetical protein HOK84_15260 [Bacteroidetes bacterium]|jgi:hypothetical protein|nr:hypothetical protein [Bacteroidota bacterium]MBT4399042.1 hypothetical protein [Bacteroidota bacterium]MBT4408277.1 hypothetical protein [Bacteroidota bacterium]MBT5427560.1 hypothetical protein [Bacteroidota bacterium]MBT7464336.1 hypothetical protein [Bacteroidota bacterium]